MTTYYVRKTGDDSTGDGSTGAPWLTLAKALSTVSSYGNHTILVGDGTYAEDNGGGVWTINEPFGATVTIKPENDTFGGVIVRAAGTATYEILIAGAVNITFDKIDFTAASTPTRAMLLIRSNATVNHLYFTNCNVAGVVEINPTSGNTQADVKFDTCTLNTINQNNTTVTTAGITITGCTISGGAGIDLIRASNVLIESCDISNTAGSYTVKIGLEDVYSAGAETLDTVVIKKCTIAGNNHVVFIGSRAKNVTVGGAEADANTVTSTGYGIIIKENTGTIVSYNTVTNTSAYACIYCKAALDPTISYNTLTNNAGTTFKVGKGDTNKCLNVDFQNNTVSGTGSNALFYWGDSTHDAGGGICDYNTYDPSGSGSFGQVRADTSVETVCELRAAWAGYDVKKNDYHSHLTGEGIPYCSSPKVLFKNSGA